MGLTLPAGLQMQGALDGVVGYSNTAGLEGGVAITNAVAVLPNVPPLQSSMANVKISAGVVHVDPAVLQSNGGAILRAGADYTLATQETTTTIGVDEYPVAALKKTTDAWFGAPDPLSALTDGTITGNFAYHYTPGTAGTAAASAWQGEFQLADAVLTGPGLAIPLTHMQGRGAFDADTFDLPRFSASLGDHALTGNYHYSLAAKHPERLRLDLTAADLSQLEEALRPALSDNGLLSRLPFTRRAIPAWLASRNMEGDIAIDDFSIAGIPMGALASHFVWHGTTLQMSNVRLKMPAGQISGSGNILLSAYSPRFSFALGVEKFPWNGGRLSADGGFESAGLDKDMLENMKASGSFSGESITLPGVDGFAQIAGLFNFAFDSGVPQLKLTKLQARQNDEDWSGEGATHPDGKLYLELTNGDRQMHAVADLTPTPDPTARLLFPQKSGRR
jgi:hypothetical protein